VSEVFTAMSSLVRDGGRITTTMGTTDVEALAGRGIRATNVMGAPTPPKLADLTEQVTAGTLRIEVRQTFPLVDAVAALAAFMAGTRGKLVLLVG